MSKDIVFECPGCRQWLEAPSDMAGLFIECPKCETVIKVPAASSVITTPPAQNSAPKPTPEKAATDEKRMSTTMRIDLPPNLGIPQPPKRRLTIRRKN